MKNSLVLKITVMAFALLSTQVFAAKENFDRSKPHKANLEKPCDIKTPACKKAMKEKMMKKKKQQVKPQNRATDYNSSRSNKADGAKAELDESGKKLKKTKSRATDYNSSRSNKNSAKKADITEKRKDEKKDDN